ncbi:hypothetical protein BDZ89DRAFT_1135256 [Hymenopellis radicata]|nr:hypothetical protein BDZ89DRAFT_1135256 [Hymenopellis radicata]
MAPPKRTRKPSAKVNDPHNVATPVRLNSSSTTSKDKSKAGKSKVSKNPKEPHLAPPVLAAHGKVEHTRQTSLPFSSSSSSSSSASKSTSSSSGLSTAEKAVLSELTRRIRAKADALKEKDDSEDEEEIKTSSYSAAKDDKLEQWFGPSASNGFVDERAKAIIKRNIVKTFYEGDNDEEEFFIKAEQEERNIDPTANDDESGEEIDVDDVHMQDNEQGSGDEMDVEDAGTVDRNQPWGSPIFESLARLQFVIGRGTADSEVFKFMVEQKSVPKQVYALVATVYEFALKQWITGFYEHIDFTASVRSRYLAHTASFDLMLERMPTYTARLQNNDFIRIMTHSNRALILNLDNGAGDDIDYEALEAAAVAEAEEERQDADAENFEEGA